MSSTSTSPAAGIAAASTEQQDANMRGAVTSEERTGPSAFAVKLAISNTFGMNLVIIVRYDIEAMHGGQGKENPEGGWREKGRNGGMKSGRKEGRKSGRKLGRKSGENQ